MSEANPESMECPLIHSKFQEREALIRSWISSQKGKESVASWKLASYFKLKMKHEGQYCFCCLLLFVAPHSPRLTKISKLHRTPYAQSLMFSWGHLNAVNRCTEVIFTVLILYDCGDWQYCVHLQFLENSWLLCSACWSYGRCKIWN